MKTQIHTRILKRAVQDTYLINASKFGIWASTFYQTQIYVQPITHKSFQSLAKSKSPLNSLHDFSMTLMANPGKASVRR